MSVECDEKLLEVLFGNRVAEVLEHMGAWRKLGIDVDQLHHWPGERNVADIATKGKATVDDVSEVSEWQLGPVELALLESPGQRLESFAGRC